MGDSSGRYFIMNPFKEMSHTERQRICMARLRAQQAGKAWDGPSRERGLGLVKPRASRKALCECGNVAAPGKRICERCKALEFKYDFFAPAVGFSGGGLTVHAFRGPMELLENL